MEDQILGSLEIALNDIAKLKDFVEGETNQRTKLSIAADKNARLAQSLNELNNEYDTLTEETKILQEFLAKTAHGIEGLIKTQLLLCKRQTVCEKCEEEILLGYSTEIANEIRPECNSCKEYLSDASKFITDIKSFMNVLDN